MGHVQTVFMWESLKRKIYIHVEAIEPFHQKIELPYKPWVQEDLDE